MNILKLIEVCRNNDYETLENVLKDEPEACLSGSFFLFDAPWILDRCSINRCSKKTLKRMYQNSFEMWCGP